MFYRRAKVGHGGAEVSHQRVGPQQVGVLELGEVVMAEEIEGEMEAEVQLAPAAEVLHFPLALPGRECNPAGIHPGSSVDIMREWLRTNRGAIYGTKQELYARILDRNKQLMKEELIDKEMERQLEARREGQPLMPVVPLPVPKQPTQIERDEHELTHAKFAPWCEACIMGKGASRAHAAVIPDDRERAAPSFECHFAQLLSLLHI